MRWGSRRKRGAPRPEVFWDARRFKSSEDWSRWANELVHRVTKAQTARVILKERAEVLHSESFFVPAKTDTTTLTTIATRFEDDEEAEA